VVVEPFKNFCYNRNFALNACKGMSDYVLLLDADMVLEVNGFNKNVLNLADSFLILQGNDSFFYQNVRIVKNNGLYSYSGVTHEYINTPPGSRSYLLSKDTFFINDIGDGGCKQNKFERDVKLLIDGILKEPNNDRYHFYLANSYFDLGKYDKAIDTYKKRIEFGGWQEEVWFSYYKIGIAYMNMDQIEKAIHTWMDGFQYYQTRLEGIYEIIKYYRLNSKHLLSYIYYDIAKIILDKNINRDNCLFLQNDIFRNDTLTNASILLILVKDKSKSYKLLYITSLLFNIL
jgi:tetratricopeptide (TPR) repeat protein